MLKDLKFVMGAVAKKDLLPAMTHFRIENGQVRSFNGQLAISGPIAFNIDCNPKATSLIKAIQQCDDTITLSMTAGGRLRVESGNFRAFVETVDGETIHPMPEGDIINFDGQRLLDACKVLDDFIGNDASRPWANGILFMGQSAFATNNVCIVEYWLGDPFPYQINLPRFCVAEILRVDEAPLYAQLHERSITFHFSEDRWIRSQLLEGEWPFERIYSVLNSASNPKPIPPQLFEGIEKLLAVADGSKRVYITDGLLRTHLEEFTGSAFEVEGIDFEGVYNITMLDLLKGKVTSADFSSYPEPCLFFGDRLRGAIIGMRA